MQAPPFPVSDYKAAFMLNSTNLTVTASAPFPVSTYDAVWMLNPPSAGGTVPDYSNGGTMNGELIVHPKITTDALHSETVDALNMNAIQGIGCDDLLARTEIRAPIAYVNDVRSTSVSTSNISVSNTATVNQINASVGFIPTLNSTNTEITTLQCGNETVGSLTALTKVETPLGNITNINSEDIAVDDILLSGVITHPFMSQDPSIDLNTPIKCNKLMTPEVVHTDSREPVIITNLQSELVTTDRLSVGSISTINNLPVKRLIFNNAPELFDILAYSDNSGAVDYEFTNYYSWPNDPYSPKLIFAHAMNVPPNSGYNHFCLRYHIRGEFFITGYTPIFPYLFDLMCDVAYHNGTFSVVNYDSIWDNKNVGLTYKPTISVAANGLITVYMNIINVANFRVIFHTKVLGFYWV